MRAFAGFGLTLALVASCAADEQPGAPAADADEAPTASRNAVRALWGIDERPPNGSCLAPKRPGRPAAVKLVPVFPNIVAQYPIGLFQAPGEPTRWYVLEHQGTVRKFANDAKATTLDPFVDIHGRMTFGGIGGETGLLGMAFDPDWQATHHVFLSYTGAGPTGLRSFVSRFTSTDGGVTLDPSSEQVILTIDQPYANHNGGNIAFGPDGLLYLGFGDGGSSGDPLGNGQNTKVLLGKILRIDVKSASPYAIPPTNPFAAGGGRGEIFAWGFRNPWRFGFDRETGALWVGDVGQERWEEIDQVQLGGNYGWNAREGTHCYLPTACTTPGVRDPVLDYPHTGTQAVIGGFVYRGKALPALQGVYLYADFYLGAIWGVDYDPVTGIAGAHQLNPAGPMPNVPSFGEALDGEVFIPDYVTGKVYTIVPDATSPPSDAFPPTLSATGCFEAGGAPTPGLIPYEVNVPDWSDGATRERWLLVPDGLQIRVGAQDRWDLPIGSVLAETLSLLGRRIETRLLVRHEDEAWGGYSYEWTDDQTDAILLPSSKTKRVGDQTWYFPSRAECLRCHAAAAGGSLGLETGQLDRAMAYPTGRVAGQLATLAHLDLVAGLRAARPLPELTSSTSLPSRARAYLHVNCSSCHRPGGTAPGTLDLRFSTALQDGHACDVLPQAGDFGIAGARILAPGDPARSLLSIRTHATDVKRMPPLPASVFDSVGIGLVDEWIRTTAGCAAPTRRSLATP